MLDSPLVGWVSSSAWGGATPLRQLLQTEQSHSPLASWMSAAAVSGRSTHAGVYDRFTFKTGYSPAGGCSLAANDRSRLMRTGARDPFATYATVNSPQCRLYRAQSAIGTLLSDPPTGKGQRHGRHASPGAR